MINALIIINPNSGKGNSLKIFNLNKHKIKHKYDVFISNYPRHVYDYFQFNNTNISKYDLLVGVGGDGIVYEILNCLQKYNLSIPIFEIPCGTGNGYFKSITSELKMPNTVESAITIINRFNIVKNDLLEITNLNLKARLAISWGIISDIDINTEWMRKLGSFRLDLGAIWSILQKRSYNGSLEYLNLETNQMETIKGKFVYFWACNVAYTCSDILSAPDSKSNDGFIYITYILNNVSRCELINIMLSLSNGKFINHKKVKLIKTNKFTLDTNSGMIVVDGELINYKKINVECHSSKLLTLK